MNEEQVKQDVRRLRNAVWSLTKCIDEIVSKEVSDSQMFKITRIKENALSFAEETLKKYDDRSELQLIQEAFDKGEVIDLTDEIMKNVHEIDPNNPPTQEQLDDPHQFWYTPVKDPIQ